MKISDKQICEFINLYKDEYGSELARVEALGQIQALVTLVKYMVPVTGAKNKSLKEKRCK